MSVVRVYTVYSNFEIFSIFMFFPNFRHSQQSRKRKKVQNFYFSILSTLELLLFFSIFLNLFLFFLSSNLIDLTIIRDKKVIELNGKVPINFKVRSICDSISYIEIGFCNSSIFFEYLQLNCNETASSQNILQSSA